MLRLVLVCCEVREAGDIAKSKRKHVYLDNYLFSGKEEGFKLLELTYFFAQQLAIVPDFQSGYIMGSRVAQNGVMDAKRHAMDNVEASFEPNTRSDIPVRYHLFLARRPRPYRSAHVAEASPQQRGSCNGYAWSSILEIILHVTCIQFSLIRF